MISTVSIVGADDTVTPYDLADISQKYPFVEWSINVCSNPSPRAGFPSEVWLESLVECADKMRLLGYLHGRWKRDILNGNLSTKSENPGLWNALHRVQIDVRAGVESLPDVIQLLPEKEFVLMTDDPEASLCGPRTSPLLSKDHLFKYPGYCGYQIYDGDIDVVLENPHDNIWISIEGFRDSNGFMDLLKVEQILDLAEDHVTPDSWMKALLETEAVQKRISRPPERIR